MAKRKPDTSEYIPEWDEGTYTTGAIQPPKATKGIVVVLLVMVIFLGGICSALGLLNIRLLQELMEATQSTTPIDVNHGMETLPTTNPLENLEIQAPSAPATPKLQLNTVQSPYYTADAPNTMDAQQVYEANEACLVDVLCLTYLSETEAGIGLVLTEDGFILTNCHLVESAKRIFVTTADGSTYRAQLVGTDSFSDLAVLYIDAQDLKAARFSTNSTLKVSEPTFAIEADRYIRKSKINSTSRLFSSSTQSLSLIQTASGSDTGPVFNSYGYVIGFQVGYISRYFPAASTMGMGLVIPSASISRIVQTLVDDGRIASRPCFGIQTEAISKVYQQYWHLPGGLLVTKLEEKSKAAACGLQEGDILLALDGQAVSTNQDMYAVLYNKQVGDAVIAVVFRNGQQFTLKLVVEDKASFR